MHAYPIPTIIYKFLLLNGSVAIPDFGVFELKHTSAGNDFTQKTIQPPQYTIRFAKDINSNPINLISYISSIAKVTEDHAIQLLNDFSAHLRKKIATDKKAEWLGLGLLTETSEGVMEFQPKLKSSDYFSGIHYQHVLRQYNNHHVKVGDDEKTKEEMEAFFEVQKKDYQLISWKMTAIYLVMLSVIILFFRFTIGNYTVLEPRWNPIKATIPAASYTIP